mgnify:FL=1
MEEGRVGTVGNVAAPGENQPLLGGVEGKMGVKNNS